MENSSNLLGVMLIAACIGSGMIAGLFCAFSSFLMKALASLPAANSIAAMQAINRFIIRPGFLLVFFGTGALCLAAVVLGWSVLGGALLTAVSATVIYIVGCLAVTVVFNVPLNNRLDAVDPASAEGQTLWAHYLSRWVRWNHVRSVATLASTLLLAMTLINLQ